MGKCYGIIYKATNKINGKIYIGRTIKSLAERIRGHISKSLNNSSGNIYFHNAIKKYGPENFEWKVIAKYNSLEELNKAEIKMIEKYNTFEKGYNLTVGGEGTVGYKFTEETRKKMSEAQKGEKSHMYGKHISEEHKRKLSEFNRGKQVSEETRRKLSEAHSGKNHFNYGKQFSEETKKRMSEAQKGERNAMYGRHHSEKTKEIMSEMRKGEKHPLYGKHHTEESIQKMSKAKIGKYLGSKNPNAKSYIVTTPEGKEIFVHGLTEFCRNYKQEKLIYKCLCACVHGRQKHHKGYKCRYWEEETCSII